MTRCRRHALTSCEECHAARGVLAGYEPHPESYAGYEKQVADLRAQLAAAETALASAREECETWKWRHEQDTSAAEAALAEEGEATERLAKAARECADDLEAELRHRYGYPDIHPAMQYKYDRDMEPVLAVRAARAPRP